jgi:hypothetical protein
VSRLERVSGHVQKLMLVCSQCSQSRTLVTPLTHPPSLCLEQTVEPDVRAVTQEQLLLHAQVLPA